MFNEQEIRNKYYICYCCTGTEFVLPELNIPEDHDWYDRPKYNSFDQTEQMHQHKRSALHRENLKEIYCESCKWQYPSHKTYEDHLDSKEHKRNSKSLICKDCNYTATTQQKLDQHLNTQKHHNQINGIQKEIHCCPDCDLTFPYPSQLLIHQQTKAHENKINGITKPTDYNCTTCHYTTTYKHHYTQHLNSKKHLRNSK